MRALPVARHSWLGRWGVRVCVPAPLVPRRSWLGCAVWVLVPGVRFWLPPATPGWDVGVCVFVCALHLYAATPGWGVRRGCVCLGSALGCTPPLLAGVLGCACLCSRSARTHPLLAGVCGVAVCVHLNRRTTASRHMLAARKEEEAPRRKEAREVCSLAGNLQE